MNLRNSLFAAALVAAAGCGSSEETAGNGAYTPPSKADVDKQIAAIDANPNMPPQAKAMQKAQMMQNGATGQKGQGTGQ